MTGILVAFVGNSYGSRPVNTVAPVVSGTATVGQTLSTTNGTWTEASAITSFTYQWQRNNVNISGATSSSYILVEADYNTNIRCVVTATNAAGTASANSNSVGPIAGLAPVNTVAPVVSGIAASGETLSTTNGTWTGVPTPSYSFQWQRGSTNISGATGSTYTISNDDIGSTLRCVVTATNASGSVSATSASTTTVPALQEQSYTAAGTYTWLAPPGVTSVSVLAVGGGGGGGDGDSLEIGRAHV